jgi:hypothetical protein
LENTDDGDVDINGAWEIIGVNVKDYSKRVWVITN